MNRLQLIADWVNLDTQAFVPAILDAFQYHEDFEHPLYDAVATGSIDDHRSLCFHTVMLWRMSKLARLQLTQMSLAHLKELQAENSDAAVIAEAMVRSQIDQAREANNGMEHLIREFEILYGSAKLPPLLQLVEEDTIQRFFDRVDAACWSERLGWSVASDYSWTHSAPSVAAGLALLGIPIIPGQNPFCHPGRYVIAPYRNANGMIAQLTTVEKRTAFVTGVIDRISFHHEIWDGFATKFQGHRAPPMVAAA